MKAACFLKLAALASMLSGAIDLSAAKPEDFTAEELRQTWQEFWRSGGPNVQEPRVEKLTEKEAVQRLAGRWNVQFGVGSEELVISLKTNRLVEVSGKSDQGAWKKTGEWRVSLDKLVLFLKEEDIPSFIFLRGAGVFIFDPWSKLLMSELKREK